MLFPAEPEAACVPGQHRLCPRCQRRAACPFGISPSNVKPGQDFFSSLVPDCPQSCSLMGPGRVPLTTLPRAAHRSYQSPCGHHPLLHGCQASSLAPTAMLDSCVGTWALSRHAHAISLTPCPLAMGSHHGLGQPTGSPAPQSQWLLAGAHSSPLPCSGSCFSMVSFPHTAELQDGTR